LSKPWNDSDLARLSADLDEELNAIFDQVEAALAQSDDLWTDDEVPSPEADPTWEAMDPTPPPAIAQTDLLTEEPSPLEDLDLALALENETPFPFGPTEAETDWLEPGLLGEPEISGDLTTEATRELSRMIEVAVEKGVAAALAKIKG
jgi:hypothetical protein